MTDAPTEILPAVAPADAAHAAPPTADPTAAVRPAGSCRTCAAPLAADQRYCLACGERVAAPRVELASAARGAGAGAAAPPPPAGGSWALLLDRVGGPMGAAAVVLVALGVGFLLGQGSRGPSGPATIVQRPPVVNVQGGGTVAPSNTSGGADTTGGGAKHGGGKGASTKGVPKAQTHDNAGGDLNRLRAQPDEQATGGTAPRADHKPSGGGSSTETIG
ncbi:MAG: hypothetical protein JSS99_05735 [Actinobacteria bacterium]|nr:hypothetical protein [Actinomycetota bacterium]